MPADPGAAQLMALLRAGDAAGFRRALSATPVAADPAWGDGITPLMYAALYGSPAECRRCSMPAPNRERTQRRGRHRAVLGR